RRGARVVQLARHGKPRCSSVSRLSRYLRNAAAVLVAGAADHRTFRLSGNSRQLSESASSLSGTLFASGDAERGAGSIALFLAIFRRAVSDTGAHLHCSDLQRQKNSPVAADLGSVYCGESGVPCLVPGAERPGDIAGHSHSGAVLAAFARLAAA